jgi:hypothetical protein
MAEFIKGDHVRTSTQGRKYYYLQDDHRKNLTGRILEVNGHVVRVRYGNGPYDVASMYDNCIERLVTEDDVAKAIESITQTPRRGQ